MTLRAFDREVGTVVDLLVDDDGWDVRYFVVEIRNAILTRRVLISPAAIEGVNYGLGQIATSLNAQQVMDSPPVDWDQPISRQYEEALVNYYGWPIYWLGRIFQSPQSLEKNADSHFEESVNTDSNLRSANEICGYRLESREGPAGYMKDLIVNMNSLKIEYALAAPGSRLFNESPVFSTKLIDNVDWKRKQITVSSTLAASDERPDISDQNQPFTNGEIQSVQSYRIT